MPNRAEARFSPASPSLHRAVLEVEVDALEVLLENEVDDTRDRVRAVHRRRAARDHLDALDRRRRNRVQVDRHRGVDRHRAIAVEQHEVAIGSEPAKAQRGRAGRGRRARVDELAVGHLRVARGRGNELRQLIQRVLDRDRALLLERRRVDRLDRAVGLVVAPHDARARDDDLFRLLLRGGFLRARRLNDDDRRQGEGDGNGAGELAQLQRAARARRQLRTNGFPADGSHDVFP